MGNVLDKKDEKKTFNKSRGICFVPIITKTCLIFTYEEEAAIVL